MNVSNQIIALLIDGDHVNSEFIDAIEKELAIIGNTTYKRVYYTYNKGIPQGWGEACNAHSLTLRQVMPYRNSKKDPDTVKNVADSALIIDAMDILYSEKVNCVCIAANDSDYTTIAKRLRESNIRMIGMGIKTTPVAFVNACDEFKYLEDLKAKYSTETKKTATKTTAKSAVKTKKKEEKTAEPDDGNAVTPKAEIENFITNLLLSEGKILDAGEIKKRIIAKWSNFNEEDYGATRMTKFFDPKKFKVIQEPGGNVNIDLLKR